MLPSWSSNTHAKLAHLDFINKKPIELFQFSTSNSTSSFCKYIYIYKLGYLRDLRPSSNLGYKDPHYGAVIDRHFERGAMLCVSCPMGITLTDNKPQILLLFCGDQWHNTSFFPRQSSTSQNSGGIPLLFLPTLQITRHFQWTSLYPYFPKLLQSKKTKDKNFKPNRIYHEQTSRSS